MKISGAEHTLDQSDTATGRIELVSRAMTTAEHWQKEVDDIFLILNEYCNIALTKGCSMHVHVSPSLVGISQTKYTMDDLRKVLKAVAYFDKPITKVMPADRKANEYAKSNLDSNTTPAVVKQAYQKVGQDTWKPLFRIYDKIKSTHSFLLEFSNDKLLSWNFKHLTDECGTIEFRRPPGVRSAAAANHWVSFTLGFISEALRTNWEALEAGKSHPQVVDLSNFVENGILRLEQTSQGALRAALLVEDRSPATVYSAAELARIKRKAAEKAKASSPFADKVRRVLSYGAEACLLTYSRPIHARTPRCQGPAALGRSRILRACRGRSDLGHGILLCLI